MKTKRQLFFDERINNQRESFSWGLLSKHRGELMGLATLWIMVFHGGRVGVRFFDGTPGLDWIGNLFTYGNMGCEIFVVLSAVGLFFAISKNSGNIYFYKRRLSRLLVPVWMIWGPYWIYQCIRGEISITQVALGFSTLRLFFDGNQSIWFVSLMTVCYLIYPAVHKVIYYSEKGALLRTTGLVCISIAINIGLRSYTSQFYDNSEIALNRIPIYILGIYLSHLVANNKQTSRYILPVSFLVFIFGVDVLNHNIIHGMNRRLFYAMPSLAALFAAAAVLEKYPAKIISTILNKMGAISLEAYCTHVLFFNLYKRDLFLYTYREGSWKKYVLLLVLAIIVAFTVDFIERKFIHNKQSNLVSEEVVT